LLKPSLSRAGLARLRALLAIAMAACGSSGTTEPPRADFRGGTAYEIFVRSFADSDGDGIGDLKGLTAHLDYLNDGHPGSATSLGVDAVWLMPTFPSPSYHGYDVTDYEGINPQYGTLADFDAFVAAAHQRGIQVLLDMVLNHSSSAHAWFIDSSAGPTAAKRDYYDWSATDLHWSRPWDQSDPWIPDGGAFYYGLFCGCMPDLNLANPAVEQALTDAMKFWLARGVDGFRLDAVLYYYESPAGNLVDQPENHAFLRRLRANLTAVAPTMVMVAEAWSSVEVQAGYYGAGDEVQLAFSFGLADALKSSATAGDASAVINMLARSETAFAGKDRNFEAPFLSNHDQVRVMRALAGDAAAARVAAAAMMAMPGTPFIYYGEELGMLGGAGNSDQNKRTFFRWDGAGPGFGFTTGNPWYPGTEAAGVDVASQQADPQSLWNHYRSLIALRRAQAALQSGDATRPVVAGGGTGVLALVRSSPTGGRILFVANFAATATGPFTVDVSGSPATLLGEGLNGSPSASSGKIAFPDLGARGFAFVSLT
jgi:glycosidase